MAKKASGEGFIAGWFKTLFGSYRSPTSFDVLMLIRSIDVAIDRAEKHFEEYEADAPYRAIRSRITEDLERACSEYDAAKDQKRKDEKSKLIEKYTHELRNLSSKRRNNR